MVGQFLSWCTGTRALCLQQLPVPKLIRLLPISGVDEVQALEEMEAMSKLNADRRKLAFGSAQADIDEKYRVMSAELQKAREEMEV